MHTNSNLAFQDLSQEINDYGHSSLGSFHWKIFNLQNTVLARKFTNKTVLILDNIINENMKIKFYKYQKNKIYQLLINNNIQCKFINSSTLIILTNYSNIDIYKLFKKHYIKIK